ncbi:MAG: IS21 family transposase [Planctomycetota bacterium]
MHEEGVANKAIARKLGVDVRTVRKYVRRVGAGAQEPQRAMVASKLDPFHERIAAKVEQGLSAVQIYQDLCGEAGFAASYETVKRRVRGLRRTEPQVYCRMQYQPGEEAQIDFGEIGRLLVGQRMRRVYLFVLTLCFSRLAYYELVLNQKVVSFLGAIRRGFEFVGGVPARLKPDNLRSAVLIDQLGQRFYQEDFFRFCRHYGTLPEAARPATPTDKGRVERDIGYAKGSAFRGRTFGGFEEAVEHLAHWRDEVANVRIHGTTRRRPVDLFEEERAALRPLPPEPYEVCLWGHYRVRKDCHVHVDGNYYSVPYLFVGQKVLVRLGEQEVEALMDREAVAQHRRAIGKGHTVTDASHYPPSKGTSTREVHRQRVQRVRAAGPHAAQLLHDLRQGPWVFGDQLARLSSLVESYGNAAFEQACQRALFFGAPALEGARPIERILDRGLEQLPLPSAALARQPVGVGFGRPLAEYDALLGAGEAVQ